MLVHPALPAGGNGNQSAPLNLDASGNLLVNVASGTITASSAAVAQSSPQTFTSGTTNPLQADTHGSEYVSLRDASGNAQGSLANPVRMDPVGTTTQPVSISGTVIISSVPATSGGLSTTKLVSAAGTNATSVKASAGQLYNVQAFNTNASSLRYLKLYNKTSPPTVGTDTPLNTWLIPANGSGVVIEMSNGLACSAGIAFAITGGMADSDTTAIAAAEVVVNLQYK